MSPVEQHVFYDPAGKRWPVVKNTGILLALITSMMAAVLCLTILLLPVSAFSGKGFRPFTLKRPSHSEAARAYLAEEAHAQAAARDCAEQHLRKRRHRAQPAQSYDTAIGFYVNWDPNSYASLRRHIDAFTYVMPQWFWLGSAEQTLHRAFVPTDTRDPEVLELAKEHDVPLIPVLSNEDSANFQWEPLRQLLTDPQRQQALAAQLRDFLLHPRFGEVRL